MSASNTKDPDFWLQRVPYTANLDERTRNVFSAMCDVASYPQGHAVIQQGARPPVIPMLVEGEVEAAYITPNRQRVSIETIKAPDLVGFLWFIDPKLRSPLAYETSKASVCLNLRTLDLENLYNSGSPLSFPILGMLYRRAAEQFRDYNQTFKRLYEAPDVTYMQLVKLASE